MEIILAGIYGIKYGINAFCDKVRGLFIRVAFEMPGILLFRFSEILKKAHKERSIYAVATKYDWILMGMGNWNRNSMSCLSRT